MNLHLDFDIGSKHECFSVFTAYYCYCLYTCDVFIVYNCMFWVATKYAWFFPSVATLKKKFRTRSQAMFTRSIPDSERPECSELIFESTLLANKIYGTCDPV
jgi:hypothetical protein